MPKNFRTPWHLKTAPAAFTYPQANRRVNKLAHSLLSLGLSKGDKVAVLLENSIEIVEVYLATAKTGIIIVPINFRLVSSEVEYITDNSDAKAFIVHDEFTSTVDPIKAGLKNIAAENYIVVGQAVEGYRPYEAFIENSDGRRTRSRNRARRHLDFDLHLRHHRQTQRGGAFP